VSRLLGTPLLTYVHAKEVLASGRLTSFALRNSTRVIAVSRYTAGLAEAAGADPARVRIIHPGVDWVAPPTEPRDDRPTIVTVARLEDRYKGHDVMVRALPLVRSQIPNVRWIVVGHGPLQRDIERLADAHGVRDSIEFSGAATDRERDRLLDRAHVFAMPSRIPAGGAGEGFGIVYREAGVHGLPVVAGAAGGVLDAVLHGETGLLVDPTNHVEVAEALTRLLADPALAARMGAAGSEHARQFSWSSISSEVERLILNVQAGISA
jgi:phosphatidylinositol alpha-1,6-mannosyltransferase